ncbi:MAG: hypothetical protein IRZ16_07665 [Myxococcaceae bacterium]|nr:hypothetical protein [Myxococcaceae bacterium]
MNVGIHGVGIYLPEQVRKNDWWPESVVKRWLEERKARDLVRASRDPEETRSEGARLLAEAMARFSDDPFKGARERRIMPEGMKTSDMEVAAAQDALARAGARPEEIDLLLVHSQLPDFLEVSNAPLIHRKLGLPARCFSSGNESACASFLHQLSLADAMIRSGRAKKALLIQSSGFAHLCRMEDPHSAWFGDGATAVVVGEVGPGRGLLGQAHYTDGSMHEALVGGYPESTWWADHPVVMYTKDRDAARRMLLSVADLGKEVIHEALQQAGLSPDDVGFFAGHQATCWMREVTQKVIGLKSARSFDSFPWTGSLGSCNTPFMLGMGEREGLLQAGDVTAIYAGGSGIVWSGMILRWGQ